MDQMGRFCCCIFIILVCVQASIIPPCSATCLEEDQNALLLLIKSSINESFSPSSNLITNKQIHASDCCNWTGVECSNITGHVTFIDLDWLINWYSGDSAWSSIGSEYWYLNTSLFLPFQELKSLYLSDFGYNWRVSKEGFERLSALTNLEELYLDFIPFNHSLLPSLAKIATLKILYLRWIKEWDYEAANISEGFERLSALSKLEELNLDYNDFNESILPSLGKIASLKKLSLSNNKITGRVPINKGFTMSKLEELNLDGNNFTDLGFICKIAISLKKLHLSDIAYLNGGINIQSFERLSCLSKLEELNLDWNDFNETILPSLGKIASLKKLSLEQNKITGRVPINKELGKLKNLQELYLDGSSIDKSFLHNVGVMTSLNVLSMSTCGLNGSLPNQGWCELKNLQELNLGHNHFEGRLPSCLANMTALQTLNLAFNNFNGSISHSPIFSLQSLEYLSLSYNTFVDDTEPQSWTSYSQLKVLLLSSSLARRPTRTIPRFLHYQDKLQAIDLSHNNLVGKFPTWLLENNTRLEIFNLRNNTFTNHFQVPYYPNPHIRKIDISNNDLGGPIPTNLGLVFPNLVHLNMSQNAFVGIIPSSLGNLVSLITLDLSSNHLSGTIPDHLGMGCLNLKYLKLSNNNLSGQLFPAKSYLTRLESLFLDHNHFSGKIPYSLSNSAYLVAFDFSSNSLSGMLPRWIGNMTNLLEIVLAKNQLEGPIPIELCKVKQIIFLDLSENNLSDFIPLCFNSLNIKHVHLGKNRLSGPITSAFKNSSALVTLDLRDNRLTGNIPDWIGNLSSLSILLLKANHLQGMIPIPICLLGSLTLLDLSNNKFTGPIPHCLSKISFGATDQKSDLGSTRGYGYNESIDFETKTQILFGNEEDDYFSNVDAQQAVEFTTKRNTYSYKAGDILNLLSGIDLSCNCLSGEIPLELGYLSNIHALNLSHNNLIGSIPTTFSNLKEIESLDLSHNKLNGSIPPQLIELNFLAVFSVADNNLSGRTPERKGQFGTFDESSYTGNPLLYGPPLPNTWNKTGLPSKDKGEESGGFIDMDFFCTSFGVSYTIVLLGIVAVLYINPYWRQVWFSFIEVCITKSFYFLFVISRKLSSTF